MATVGVVPAAKSIGEGYRDLVWAPMMREYVLWAIRSIMMAAIGCLFIWAAITSTEYWLAKALIVFTGLVIFYVEAWAWWRRLIQ